MKQKKKLKSVLLAAAIIVVMPFQAHAAGFYIQEQSVQALGYAFSGSVTALDDPSTIYFNPAGMTRLPGTQIQAGVNLLVPVAKLTDTGSTFPGGTTAGDDGGNPYNPTPVPNGYISYEVGHGLWAGLGISAPFGLASDYGNSWFGRYDSTKTELTTIDIQPTLAFEVEEFFSIGGGLNIQYADAKLESAVFAGSEGLSSLTGEDWSYGYTIGIQLRPTSSTTFGASYRSDISHELDGRIVITGSGAADRSDAVSAELNLPDIATFGLAQKIGPRWRVMGQATWFGWNNFQDIDPEPKTGVDVAPIVQNYQTTWAFSLGAEYFLNDEWTLRGGIQFDETPTTDEYRTTRTPDGDRTWLSLGATYNVNQNMVLDMAGTYINVTKEDINLTRNIPAIPTTVSAEAESQVGIFSMGLTYKF